MIRVDIADAETHLREHLSKLSSEEVLVLCENEIPIAEVRRLVQSAPTLVERPLGIAAGEVVIHPSFFEPLPEEILAAFEGKPV